MDDIFPGHDDDDAFDEQLMTEIQFIIWELEVSLGYTTDQAIAYVLDLPPDWRSRR